MVPASFSTTNPMAAAAAFELSGEEFALSPSGALYWPRESTVLVADLHLEKGSYYAQAGQMLPPYDSRATLEALADAVKVAGARRVITLGDNFHDDAGAHRLDPYCAGMLEGLTRSLDWIWITGNHDAELPRGFGGAICDEMEVNGIKLRHEAQAGEETCEISGHYHPKMRMRLRGRHIARACGVIGSMGAKSAREHQSERMIMPAFGAYTGGMDAAAPEIRAALSPATQLHAVLPAKGKLLRFALNPVAA